MKNQNESLKESILMAREVDLAGEFIYAGLEKMNSMKSLDEPSEAFFVLYHLAVGIERLQKVLIVLLEDVQPENIKDFLVSIKVHNHKELADRINQKVNINFSKEQNAFINSLSDFYTNHRYDEYDFFKYNLDTLNCLSDFLKMYYKNYESCYSLIGKRYIINDEIKEFIGRIVGRIGQKYYKEIYNISVKRNIFSYELRVESAAYKIFMINDERKSYQEELDKEENAIKELLIFLMNSESNNSFFRFMKEITPLNLDSSLIEERVLNLCKKRHLTELVDEIDYNYFETEDFTKDELKDRKERLRLIANDNVRFWTEDIEDDEE